MPVYIYILIEREKIGK